MGCIRLFLALTVCINHFWSLPFYRHDMFFGLGPHVAVEVFFIISGFYMALILSEKYVGQGMVGKFYQNRFLRLYPTYLLVVLLYIAVNFCVYVFRDQVLASLPLEYFSQGDWTYKLYAIVSNFFIIGQDLAQFTGFNHNSGSLCLGAVSSHPTWLGLLVPQAWSIEIEFMFYVMAPWIVRLNTRRLACLTLGMLALKFYVDTWPFQNTSWHFRFPPLEFSLFLLGVLSYRLYRALKAARLRRGVQIICVLYFMIYLASYEYMARGISREILLFLMAFVCIPCAFLASKRNRFDRALGELSYPVYLLHQMVIQVVMLLAGRGPAIGISIGVTLVLAFALHGIVLRPLESFRQRRVASPAPARPGAMIAPVAPSGLCRQATDRDSAGRERPRLSI